MTRELDERIRLRLTVLGIVSLVLVTGVDYLAGPATRVNILFVVPVLLLTRSWGRLGGLLTALVSSGMSVALDLMWTLGGPDAWEHSAENAAFRGIMLVFIAILFGNLRETNTALDRQVREEYAALETDIVKREQVEKRLRERELLLSATLASTVDGILVVDNEGKTLLTNRQFAELWRIPESILDTEDDAAMLSYVRDQLVDPVGFLDRVESLYTSDASGTDTLTFKDDRIIERFTVPLVADGVRIGRVWAFRDTTPRKIAERALRASEERLRILFDRAVDGILIVSPEGRVVSASRSFAEMHGYTPEEVLSMTLESLNPPEDHEKNRERLRHLLAGDSLKFEVEHNHRDGHMIPLEVNASLVVVDQQPLVQAFHRDITERKRTEAAMRALLQDKEALIKEVHHRVKNNLQVISSLLRLESARSAHSGIKVVLEDMRGRVRSMAALHETLYRSDTLATVELGGYLRRVSTDVFRAQATSPSSVQLHLDLCSIQVEMDQAMPCGLLVNELLSNALEHGFPGDRTGEIRVSLRVVDDGRQLCLRVSDTGVGLPVDFEIRRINSLGLQLASDLSQQLGGSLNVGPPPAAVFSVTFPIHQQSRTAEAV